VEIINKEADVGNNYSGQERRKFKRVKINLVVVYHPDRPLDVVVMQGSKEERATMLDISQGGMSILAKTNIPISTNVWIKFTLMSSDKDHADFYGNMEVKGQVRYGIAEPGGRYRLGISFLGLNEKDSINISSFVESLEKGKKS
jgi:c-di-GMP-binding flagellar brake protein YcgR